MPQAERLWDFALRLYAVDCVSTACLALQDDHGADVTLLLYAAWMGAVHRHALTPDEAGHAREAVCAWHDEIVRPLRAVRRRMKTGPGPAPGTETEALRDRLKSVELGAERLELATLERLAPPPAPDADAGAATIERNMALFLHQAPGSEASSALQRIAEAAAILSPGR